jgi:uncharacterized protein YaaQ
MLSCQIKNVTKMIGVERYEIMQLRKMVKEDLFKRVKIITMASKEKKCLQYLANKLMFCQKHNTTGALHMPNMFEMH